MYEELVERLRDRARREDEYYAHGGDVINEAADAIERLIAFNAMWQGAAEFAKENKPKWIPVTERLPEKYTAVLAAGNGEVACGLFVGFAEPAHVVSWDLDNVAAEPVTHWMPLPEPPKEE